MKKLFLLFILLPSILMAQRELGNDSCFKPTNDFKKSHTELQYKNKIIIYKQCLKDFMIDNRNKAETAKLTAWKASREFNVYYEKNFTVPEKVRWNNTAPPAMVKIFGKIE